MDDRASMEVKCQILATVFNDQLLDRIQIWSEGILHILKYQSREMELAPTHCNLIWERMEIQRLLWNRQIKCFTQLDQEIRWFQDLL